MSQVLPAVATVVTAAHGTTASTDSSSNAATFPYLHYAHIPLTSTTHTYSSCVLQPIASHTSSYTHTNLSSFHSRPHLLVITQQQLCLLKHDRQFTTVSESSHQSMDGTKISIPSSQQNTSHVIPLSPAHIQSK